MSRAIIPKYKIYTKISSNLFNNSKILSFKRKKWKNMYKTPAQKYIYLNWLLKKKNKSKLLKFFYVHSDQQHVFFRNRFFIERINLHKNFYRLQLLEKQKIKLFFGGKFKEKQLRTLYLNCFKRNLSYRQKYLKFFNRLQNRFDFLLVRTFFSRNIFEARQQILHGFFKVNGKTVTYPFFTLKVGDIVSVNKEYQFNIYKHLSHNFIKIKRKKKLKIFSNTNVEINYNILTFIILNENIMKKYLQKFDMDLFLQYYRK